MRIALRDENRRPIGRIEVDASLRPTRATVQPGETFGSSPTAEPSPREVFLNWDTALDDSGRLRKCIACDCTDLYTEKAFPIVTGAVVALAFLGAALGAAGLADTPPVLIGMGIVLVLDVAILLFSRRRLVCYRCRTTYHNLPIARYHRPWDRATADRHPAPGQQLPAAAPPAPTPAAEPIALPTVTRTAPVAATDKGYFA